MILLAIRRKKGRNDLKGEMRNNTETQKASNGGIPESILEREISPTEKDMLFVPEIEVEESTERKVHCGASEKIGGRGGRRESQSRLILWHNMRVKKSREWVMDVSTSSSRHSSVGG